MITAPSPFLSGLNGLSRANALFDRSSQRLATGLRINAGRDDPAGLIASESIGADLAANDARLRTLDRASFTIMTEDGALGVASRGVEALSGLVVRGANTGAMTPAESEAIRTGAGGIVAGLDRVMRMSGSPALDAVRVQEQIGTDPVSGEPIYETYTLNDLPELVGSNPGLAQELVDGANGAIAARRAELGAEQRGDEAVARATETEQINLAAARSAIRDADFARQSSERTRAGILGSASISVILAKRDADARILDLLA